MDFLLDALTNWLKAVSYTHLDVYKRQLSAANDPQDRPVEDEKVYLLRLLHQ